MSKEFCRGANHSKDASKPQSACRSSRETIPDRQKEAPTLAKVPFQRASGAPSVCTSTSRRQATDWSHSSAYYCRRWRSRWMTIGRLPSDTAAKATDIGNVRKALRAILKWVTWLYSLSTPQLPSAISAPKTQPITRGPARVCRSDEVINDRPLVTGTSSLRPDDATDLSRPGPAQRESACGDLW